MKYGVKRKTAAALLLIAVTLGLLACAWWFLTDSAVLREYSVEAGQSVSAEDFLRQDAWFPSAAGPDLSGRCWEAPGDYPLELTYGGRVFRVVLHVTDSRPPEAEVRDLTVFAARPPAPEDFLLSVEDLSPVTLSFGTPPDMALDGTQTVSLILTDAYGNRSEVSARLTVVVDKEAPEILGARSLRVYLGGVPEYLAGVTVTDALDPNAELTVDDGAVDLTRPGAYPLIYRARDTSGNLSELTVTVTVIEDTQGPRILGAGPLSLYQGSTVAYRRSVILEDDYDENPVLTVDSSQVNLLKPGVYPLIYRAVDEAGNETVLETTVTVKEKTEWWVEESVIFAAADDVLARILTPDMTVRQQVEAIYDWSRYRHHYNGFSDKTDRLQAAYSFIVTGEGDCFSYHSATTLLFDRLGIPYINVERAPGGPRDSRHYWSMVSVDGGKTYYHFDSTPINYVYERLCLVTDALLDEISRSRPGYYYRDKSRYPATPEQPCDAV